MVGQRANQAFAALQPLAGRFAGRIARLWPAPYDGYRRLPAARRHLAHITLSRIDRAPGLDAHAFVREIESLRTRAFLARWAPGAPRGLENALSKLGDAAWSPSAYRRLVGLLAHGRLAVRTLRHVRVITPQLVETLEALPERLRGPATARWVRGAWEARVVSETVALAKRLPGDPARAEERMDALVERLSRARSRERFYAMLRDALRPMVLPAPLEETATLRPLRTVAEVEDAGRRFRNCLADCVHDAVVGRSAFVEWRGEDEPAVMEIHHEGLAGWRLLTLLGVANRAVSARTTSLVRKALEAQGVRTGMGAGYLLHQLGEIAEEERHEDEYPPRFVAAAE
jgi:hypothetical protein